MAFGYRLEGRSFDIFATIGSDFGLFPIWLVISTFFVDWQFELHARPVRLVVTIIEGSRPSGTG